MPREKDISSFFSVPSVLAFRAWKQAALRRGIVAIISLFILLPVVHATAHPADMSVVRVELQQQQLQLTLVLAWRELSAKWIPATGQADYAQAVANQLRRDGPGLFTVVYDERAVQPLRMLVVTDKPGITRCQFTYPPPPPGTTVLRVQSNHLANLPNGHQQLITAEDARLGPADAIFFQDILTLEQDTAETPLPRPRRSVAAASQPAASQPTTVATTGPTAAEPSSSARAASGTRDRLSRLLNTPLRSPGLLALAFLGAMLLGSFHALAPGHGKTIVAAYLVGSRGTPGHAILLGAIVTVTHVIGVVALGVVAMLTQDQLAAEQVSPWLEYVSGILVAAVGVWQLSRRLAVAWMPLGRGPMQFVGASNASVGLGVSGHYHGPGGHTHDMPDRITPASLLALGVSGGIVPCPSALILMVVAIAIHRVALGLGLIVAFSAGLAIVLIAIGLLMLYARQWLDRLRPANGISGSSIGRWLKRLPIASAAAITLLGLLLAARALFSGQIL